MPWTRPEIVAVQMAKRALGWHDPQYQLVLRNVAGVRPWPGGGGGDGKVSSTNPYNTTAGFVRFMAFCEKQGFVDPKQGQGYWIGEAAKQCPQMHHKIHVLARQLQEIGVMADATAALPGFIHRQTRTREEGPTNILADLDFEYSYKVLEGLKAWLYRECKQRGITLPL